jgi:DNA-binding NarL/FixJ family response regulator
LTRSEKKTDPEILELDLEISEFVKSSNLSTREGEIFRLLLSRFTTAEDIGKILKISPHTVNNHLQNLFEKTNTTNKTEVVAAFVRHILTRLNHCKMFVKQPAVLVIDDEPDIVSVITEYLSEKGVKVHSFTDPEKALAAVSELKIDFIISDIDMPKLDGMTLLKEVRRFHKYLPMMIFVTGKPIYTVEKSLALGAVAFLEKPIKLGKLFFVIMEHFIEGTAERSRLLRIDATLPSTVNQVYNLTTSNVGFGGAFLPFGDKLPSTEFKVGTVFDMTFTLGEASPPISTKAEVVWRRENPGLNLPAGMGVRFLDLEQPGKDLLEDYVRVHKITSFIPLG